MKIQVKIKTVYGNELIYPASREALIFAALTGKKTLSTADIRLIQDLGYEIEVTHDTDLFKGSVK